MYKIKFELKKEPTDLKIIAKWPIGFGLILLALTFIIVYVGSELPLAFIVELVDNLFPHFITLGITSLLLGFILDFLSWQKGELSIADDRLLITGDKEFYLRFENMTRITYPKKRLVQIRTRYYPIRLKFNNSEDLKLIREALERETQPR